MGLKPAMDYLSSELCRISSGQGNGGLSNPAFVTHRRAATRAETDIINDYANGVIDLEECERRLAEQPDPKGFREIR